MTTLNLAGHEIYICTRTEAKEIWKNEPDKRSRIFLEDEFISTIPLDTPEVLGILEQKRQKPGYTFKRQTNQAA